MNKNNNEIEKLFKESFQNFEKPAGAEVWTGVKASINSGLASTVSATAAKVSLGAKVAIVAAVVGVASLTTYFIVNQDDSIQNSTGFVEKTAPINSIEEQEVLKDENNNLSSLNSVSADTATKISAVEEVIVELNTNKIIQENNNASIQKEETKKTEKATNENSTKNIDKVVTTNTINEKTTQKTENMAIEKTVNTNAVVKDNATNNTSNTIKPEETKVALVTEININQTEGNGPLDIHFNSNYSAYKYEWKLNDRIISTNQSDNYRIDKVGNYQLQLTVIDENNKKVSSTKTINVLPIIANIFTPNGDGANDIFRIDGDFDQLEVRIFDKASNEIHNWTGNYGFWDGDRADGSLASEGTYLYTVKYSLNGIEKIKKGTLTLKR